MIKILSRFFYYLLIILIFLLKGCTERKFKEPHTRILAKIGSKKITVSEFIKRAEYTIRPSYCRTDYGHSKKIVLNSLIAEKMLAQEINPDSVIKKGSHLAKYIRGRKEQSMRRFHFYKKGTQKVKLDSSEIKDVYKLAGREYKVKYFNFPDQKLAKQFIERLRQKQNSFQKVIDQIGINDKIDIPEMKVRFNSSKAEEIHKALYGVDAKKVHSGDILGPIQTHAKEYIILKIDSVHIHPAISSNQIKTRYKDVKNKLEKFKAKNIYVEYVHNLMAGKKMNFNKNIFDEIVTIFSEIYHITQQNENQTASLWGKNINQELPDSLGKDLDNKNGKVFFTLNGQKWTVADFREELLIHPLVFRKKNIQNNHDFAKQFRLAVADLIRDHFITKDAYQLGYDKSEYVRNYTNMWRDNILAAYGKYKYLENSGYQGDFRKNYREALESHLNRYVDSLQNVYSDQISINAKTFNKIKLTGIDLMAIESNVPYPIKVPPFPILTTDAKLDYGKIK